MRAASELSRTSRRMFVPSIDHRNSEREQPISRVEVGALGCSAVELVPHDAHGRDVDDAGDLLGHDGEKVLRLHAFRHEGGDAAQRVQLGTGSAPVRYVSRHSVHDAFLRPGVRVPFESARRAVGADLATLESNDVFAGREFGEDCADGSAIVGVGIVHERPGKQLFLRVPEHARERWIGELQVPVEPCDAERIKRQVRTARPSAFMWTPAPEWCRWSWRWLNQACWAG
jgi:hypothetical protein